MNSKNTSTPSDFDWDKFAAFLELPYEEIRRRIDASGLSWFKRFSLKRDMKWWCNYLKQYRSDSPAYADIKGITLWESMRKGRF